MRPASRWVAPALLAALLVAHGQMSLHRLRAQRLLWSVESRTIALLQTRSLTRQQIAAHLHALADAERLDPSEVGIPTAIGGQHFLLGQTEAARTAYRRARQLEPRPEILLNLGKLRLMEGQRRAAVVLITRAVALDPWLKREVPAELLEPVLDALRSEYRPDGADEDG